MATKVLGYLAIIILGGLAALGLLCAYAVISESGDDMVMYIVYGMVFAIGGLLAGIANYVMGEHSGD